MLFDQKKSIYQQIADQMRDSILTEEWVAGDKIPSIREMSVSLGVNPNTVSRSYQSLTENMIIENRRGIGYFVTETAREKIMEEMRRIFLSQEIYKLFETMNKLEISMDELIEKFKKYKGDDDENKQ